MPSEYRIEFANQFVRLVDPINNHCLHVDLSLVQEIATFKRDCGIYDLVCLGFRIGDQWAIFHDDYENWPEFCGFVTSRFELDPLWDEIVARPAFATNYRSLWGEPTPAVVPVDGAFQRFSKSLRRLMFTWWGT